MNKTWIIIKREYLTRVRNKTFLLSTFLLPLVMVGFIFGSAYLGAKSIQQYKIAVKDESGLYNNKLDSSNAAAYSFSNDYNLSNYKATHDGLLIIYAKGDAFPDSVVKTGVNLKRRDDEQHHEHWDEVYRKQRS